MDGIDPARVWAFVADPENLPRWAPARSTGYMGTELPAVGHTLFLHQRRRADPETAWRCRIEIWDAGHRVRCALETPGVAAQQTVEVTVGSFGSGRVPASGVLIAYEGNVPPLAAPLYRWRVRAMQRTALAKIRKAVTPAQ